MTTPNTPTPPFGYRMLKEGDYAPNGSLIFIKDYGKWMVGGPGTGPDATTKIIEAAHAKDGVYFCAPIEHPPVQSESGEPLSFDTEGSMVKAPSDPIAAYRDKCRARILIEREAIGRINAQLTTTQDKQFGEGGISMIDWILTEVLI